MKGIKKVLITILTIILLTIFSYNIYNFVNIKILKNDMTSVFGYAMLEVISGSMEPNIHPGDMIIIDTLNKTYKVNDIVTFYDEKDSFITHRIISLDGTEMITKGDNNNTEDKASDTSNIVGKYVTKIPGLGRIISAFKNPFTMIMILIIGILTCILVSTDKEGNPILEEDEKEFKEFLKNQGKTKGKENDIDVKSEKIVEKKEKIEDNKIKEETKREIKKSTKTSKEDTKNVKKNSTKKAGSTTSKKTTGTKTAKKTSSNNTKNSKKIENKKTTKNATKKK